MGWKDELHDASFRGVQFECTSVSGSQAKTVAINQAPYSNDATVEDMGNEARRITINAMYTGDDYLTWRKALEAAIVVTGPGELIHPTEGILQVQVLDHSVNEDAENPDFCSFSINFLVIKTEKRELFIPIQTTTELTALDIIKSPANQFKKTLEKLKALQPEQFYSVVKDVRDALQSVRTGLNLAKVTSVDILSPDVWATGLVDDISRLVNFDFSISALSQWRDVIKRVERFDHVFDETSNLKELKQLWRATQVASVVGMTQQVIQKTRDEMLEQQGKPVQDPTTQQNQISMTPMDLAKVRASTREKIQVAIQAEREYGGLNLEAVSLIQNYKHIADQIHLQIQELIEVRPPIITMVIPVPCTFHWLAHYLYEDMTRAAEIRRLNQDIENPALLLKGMEVSVYAQ